MQQDQEKKSKINKNQITHKQIKPKLKPKQPVKTKKQKRFHQEKKVNVDKQLTCPVCRRTSKEGQMNWIVYKIWKMWVHEDCSANEACFLCE